MKKTAFLAAAIAILGCALFFGGAVSVRADTPDCAAGQTCLTNPLTATTPEGLIRNVLTGILGIVGSLALLMFVYGGFTWMLAAGNAENVKRGRDILVWATIGLVVIFSSYALIGFIMKSLGVK